MTFTVQLGRAGDIMSVLPMLWKEAQSGAKPKLMAAAEFAPLLEGVGYVEPVIFNGPHYEIDKAMGHARALDATALCTQVNGPTQFVREFTYNPAGQTGARSTSFDKEVFKVAGKLTQWDECWPLVFDKRDEEREQKLLFVNSMIGKQSKKPVLLLALKSNSSPFPYEDLIRELLTLKFGSEYRILEMPQAERIYDLLAIYERASLLIAVDSAPLHLAWACRKLPVFALTQDRPLLWHGSSWRPNHVWYCRYHDWPARAVEMLNAINSLKDRMNGAPFVNVWSAYHDRLHYPVVPFTLPIKRGMCGRDSSTVLQDPARHPYLRDVIRMAIQRADTDSMELRLMRPRVGYNLQRYHPRPPYYAYRIDENGQFQPIVDLLCATRKQWRDYLPEIPDFVLNDDLQWGEALRVLFQQRGATDATGCCNFVKDGIHL